MPKRDGPRKGHKCSKEFDRFCAECWERRLKTAGLGECQDRETDKVTYVGRLTDVENVGNGDPYGEKSVCGGGRQVRKNKIESTPIESEN